ncbi:MAG: PepSY domain-containing protein [Methylococcaceae bacterium]|nr:PepSY domain-containing protein [Methylococcaceae bacterium]
MNKQHNKFLTAIFAMVIMTGTAANVAQAGESKEKEAKELKLFSEAKISLSEAIKAAEHKVGGKAMEAEVDDESNTVQFEIEILKDGKIHEVIVDGITGKVLKVSLDDESNESTENEKE